MNLFKNSLTVLVILAGLGVGAFFYSKNKREKNNVNPIRTETPTKKDIEQTVNASGKLKAVVQITVGSLVSGRVIDILVKDNDIVKKNQVLAILDNGMGDSEVKKIIAELAQAQAQLDFQDKFYSRQKALYASGQISQNSFDDFTQSYKIAQAQVKKLQAALEISKKTYNNLFVKAPEDSIVISKMVDLGQMITSQLQATALFTLAKNLQEMEAHIDVDEADIGLVKNGQEATFSVDAFPKMKFTAKVKYIKYLANIVDNVVTYDTVLDVPNPDLRLRPGMTVNVDIKIAECTDTITVPNKAFRVNPVHIENAAQLLGLTVVKAETPAVKIPRSGIHTNKTDKDYVWVLDKTPGKKITQVEVQLGATDGKNTEVKGIALNDQVVTEVEDVKRENLILKGMFGKPAGGLGK